MLDWRDAKQYEFFPGKLPAHRCAWEFLRRNSDYRKDWSTALSQFCPSREIQSSEIEDPEFYLPVGGKTKWRLLYLLNPSTDEPKRLGFDLDYVPISVGKKGTSFKFRGPAYPIVEFDLQLPPNPQTEKALKHLRDLQRIARAVSGLKPHRVTQHRNLWPLYLRLLDAKFDRRNTKQITDVLDMESPSGGLETRKVLDQLNAARAMTEPEGYLSIFHSVVT